MRMCAFLLPLLRVLPLLPLLIIPTPAAPYSFLLPLLPSLHMCSLSSLSLAHYSLPSDAQMYSHAADFESRQIERQSGEMVEAQHASRMLLKNLLPSNIVDQINQGRGLIADYFDDVTVLFTDMKGFTAFSSTITPQRLVEFLNEMYVLKYAGNPGLGILPF